MTVVLKDKDERERTAFEVAEVFRQEMSEYAEIIDYQASVSSGMGGSASTVDVEIYGHDFDKTNILAENVQQIIRANVPSPGYNHQQR